MLISQPISSCLTNHSELYMSGLLNNQPGRISIYRLQRRPSFGFESSVSYKLRWQVVTLWLGETIAYDIVFIAIQLCLPRRLLYVFLSTCVFTQPLEPICIIWFHASKPPQSALSDH